MSVINILDANIFNRIAAGEVVERPASVVKELVENSIDAGATSIVIEIKRGGKEVIKVSDNGCGIAKEDLKKAFLPHATSKVKTLQDLDRIGTLGFRGEALPSILAVADVKVVTKPATQELGASIQFSGAQSGIVEDAGSPDGTYFAVSKLFERIPARAKFLEKDYQEESAVTDLVSRLILSHPNIAFRYLADSKKVYQSYGQGLKDALTAVYGGQILEDVLELNFAQYGMTLSGFIGRESFTKPNRTYQTLIVNNRYVVNQTVTNAVYYAYVSRLMKRQYPFFVLYLSLPNERVDVNVHPNKLEVRFIDKNAVYSLVNVTVAQTLTESYMIPSAESAPAASASPVMYKDENHTVSIQSRFHVPAAPSTSKRSFEESSEIFARATEIMKSSQSAAVQSKSVDLPIQEPYLTAELPLQYKVVGVAFDTYLVLQIKNELYWIDQHAAHERLLYDRIKNDNDAVSGVQNLLIPYVFNVNAVENAWLHANLTNIRACGIEMEEFGEKTYKISSLPLILSDMNSARFVEAILADISNGYSKSNSDIIKDKLMQEACKAAVKGGDKLNDDELACIMKGIADTKATLMCPHGRPIAVKLDKTVIEKWFKRIAP